MVKGILMGLIVVIIKFFRGELNFQKKFKLNEDAIIYLCEAEHQRKDLHVMEYYHVQNYLNQNPGLTCVDWCGRDLTEDDKVYWIRGAEPQQFVFSKTGEDITGEKLQELLSYLEVSEDELKKYKKKGQI